MPTTKSVAVVAFEEDVQVRDRLASLPITVGSSFGS